MSLISQLKIQLFISSFKQEINRNCSYFFFPNSHFVRSFIKKGLVPGSGLSSLTENDETATFSQIDLNQLTKAMSQVTMLLLLVAQFLTMKVFFSPLICEIHCT